MNKKLIIIYTLLIIFNMIFNISALNLLVTIPEFIIVLFFLFKNIDMAIFFHMLFLITSPTYYINNDSMMMIDITSFTYAKLKIIGNIPYSAIMSILIIIIILARYGYGNINKIRKEKKLFYRMYLLLIYFFLTAIVVGLFGFLLLDYKIEGVNIYGSYMILTLINATMLVLRYNERLIKLFYDSVIPLVISSILAIFIVHLFNYFNIIGYSLISFYSAILIPAILYYNKKEYIIILMSLILYIINLINGSVSGKAIYSTILFAIATIFLSRSKYVKRNNPIMSKLIFIIIIAFIILIPTITNFISRTHSGDELISSKVWQVGTVQSFVSGTTSVDYVAHSPYVRIAEFANVSYEAFYNPIYLIFGHGYGGYFRDNLHMFNNVSLGHGDYDFKEISSGEYYAAHDTLSVVPFLNGFLGLFLLLRLIYFYIKDSKYNYLRLAVIPYLLLAFYFDTLNSFCGLVFLFASEYKIQKN